jgi:hypothetical protein
MTNRYTAAEIAHFADIVPETVEDWKLRGLVPVAGSNYSSEDALRFTAVASLAAHGVPVYRAAETVRRIEETQGPAWKAALRKCEAGEAHVYVYTVFYSSQAFGTFLYAGDSAKADAFIQASMSDASAGELVGDDDPISDYPVTEDAPRCRVARYDIGADLRRAFVQMGQ